MALPTVISESWSLHDKKEELFYVAGLRGVVPEPGSSEYDFFITGAPFDIETMLKGAIENNRRLTVAYIGLYALVLSDVIYESESESAAKPYMKIWQATSDFLAGQQG